MAMSADEGQHPACFHWWPVAAAAQRGQRGAGAAGLVLQGSRRLEGIFTCTCSSACCECTITLLENSYTLHSYKRTAPEVQGVLLAAAVLVFKVHPSAPPWAASQAADAKPARWEGAERQWCGLWNVLCPQLRRRCGRGRLPPTPNSHLLAGQAAGAVEQGAPWGRALDACGPGGVALQGGGGGGGPGGGGGGGCAGMANATPHCRPSPATSPHQISPLQSHLPSTQQGKEGAGAGGKKATTRSWATARTRHPRRRIHLPHRRQGAERGAAGVQHSVGLHPLLDNVDGAECNTRDGLQAAGCTGGRRHETAREHPGSCLCPVSNRQHATAGQRRQPRRSRQAGAASHHTCAMSAAVRSAARPELRGATRRPNS